jgi:uncharacterized membrane protein
MASSIQHIEVNVPLSVAYNQWTQFEEFPRFMEGVKQVHQLDERIAWRSVGGKPNAGVATFHYIDQNRTRVTVQMDYEPEGVVEDVGSAIGMVDRRLQGDLERFKEFVESRGRETDAWRGTID